MVWARVTAVKRSELKSAKLGVQGVQKKQGTGMCFLLCSLSCLAQVTLSHPRYDPQCSIMSAKSWNPG